MATGTLYTIGHSTHPIEEFLQILQAHGIQALVDVRSIPKSRHCPQFNAEALGPALETSGISYFLMKKLGGRRSTRKSSMNTGWRNASFRGYADYMATEAFAEGLSELIVIAAARKAVVMCAEAVPWRCHRSMIADAMIVRGWEVRDILSAALPAEHHLTPFLRFVDGLITYPPESAASDPQADLPWPSESEGGR